LPFPDPGRTTHEGSLNIDDIDGKVVLLQQQNSGQPIKFCCVDVDVAAECSAAATNKVFLLGLFCRDSVNVKESLFHREGTIFLQ